MTSAAAAAAAFCCGCLLAGPVGVVARLGPAFRRTGWTPGYDGRGRSVPWLLPVAAAAAVGLWLMSPRYLLAGIACAVAAALVGRSVRQRRERQHRRRRRDDVVAACDAAAAELRAGLSAFRAVERSFAPVADFAAVAAAAQLGGDVAAALDRCASLPGADGLRAVAAAWRVAGRSGAGLASVLDRIVDGLRSDEEARAEVEAALEAPRATAKLLALLPLAGLGLGSSIGAHPVRFLLSTEIGVGCLSVGLLLALLGVSWVERLARAVED